MLGFMKMVAETSQRELVVIMAMLVTRTIDITMETAEGWKHPIEVRTLEWREVEK